MSGNDLVVEAPDRGDPFETGDTWRGDADLMQLTGPVNGLVETGEALKRGDFAEAGLDLAGTGLSALGFISDPLAGLFSVGIGFLVDHMEPFPTWLDQLCGDPEAIEAFSATWSNVGSRVHSTADEYVAAAGTASDDWSGLTPTAYRGAAHVGGTAIHGMGTGIQGVALGMEFAGAAVSYVRGLVRDQIVSLVSFALARAVEFLTIAGAGPAVARFVARVVKDTNSMRKKIDELIKTIERLNDKLGRLLMYLQQVGDKSQLWSQRVGLDKWTSLGDYAVPALQALSGEDDDAPAVAPV